MSPGGLHQRIHLPTARISPDKRSAKSPPLGHPTCMCSVSSALIRRNGVTRDAMDMTTPIASIGLPVYNRAKLLQKSLDTLTTKPVEHRRAPELQPNVRALVHQAIVQS